MMYKITLSLTEDEVNNLKVMIKEKPFAFKEKTRQDFIAQVAEQEGSPENIMEREKAWEEGN